jgi:hypothetical protein
MGGDRSGEPHKREAAQATSFAQARFSPIVRLSHVRTRSSPLLEFIQGARAAGAVLRFSRQSRWNHTIALRPSNESNWARPYIGGGANNM